MTPEEKLFTIQESQNKTRIWATPDLYIIDHGKTLNDPYGSGSDDFGGAYDS